MISENQDEFDPARAQIRRQSKKLQIQGAQVLTNEAYLTPLKNVPFCPIPVSGSGFNPRNTLSIPVVEILALLDLEQK